MADFLNTVLARSIDQAISRKQTKPLTIAEWSNAQLIDRSNQAPILPDAMCLWGERIVGRVLDLSPDTVVKVSLDYCLEPEVRALEFVHSHTSVPVPKVHRFVESDGMGYLVMEKIHGTRLDKIWPSFSALQKFWIAWTLRGYIDQLRQASSKYSRHHIPGPMADEPRDCEGALWLFGHREIGCFQSAAELIEYFNQRRRKIEGSRRFDDVESLVLTHGDLSMRNIIVGHDGKVWVVDWQMSGFYPVWFEYMATMSAAENDNAPGSWWKHIPLVVGGVWLKEKELLGFKGVEASRFHRDIQVDGQQRP